jgi:CheY-like chemotaxis protein
MVSIPILPLQSSPDVPRPASPGRALRKALVVEDSAIAAEQLSRYLSGLDIECTVCPSGDNAAETALTYAPDIVFLDILLPGQSGWTVLEQLKSDSQTRDIPVVVVSIVDDRGKALSCGAADLLLKPVSREHIERLLARLSGSGNSCAANGAPDAHLSPGRLVLLAEDSEQTAGTVADYLRAHGFSVSLARNGDEAVSRARELRPALIFMDIQMPVMDGLEATRLIRANPELDAIPIVALTALAMPGDRELCLKAGADQYLTKPVSLKVLAELARRLTAQPRRKDGETATEVTI